MSFKKTKPDDFIDFILEFIRKLLKSRKCGPGIRMEQLECQLDQGMQSQLMFVEGSEVIQEV